MGTCTCTAVEREVNIAEVMVMNSGKEEEGISICSR